MRWKIALELKMSIAQSLTVHDKFRIMFVVEDIPARGVERLRYARGSDIKKPLK
jgi:hypothetical protein